jgi:two-component system, LytTR family, response regulator
MQVIPLRQNSGNVDLFPAQIVRIESSSNYSRVFFTNRPPLLVCKILQWFEDLLPEESFVRVHRSHLVNRAFIAERPNKMYLLMQNGQVVPVSRRKRKGAVG